MLYKFRILVFACFLIFVCTNCKDEKPELPVNPQPNKQVQIPKFERDSAYNYVAKQVAFGPRVPNTPEHVACKNWLADKMKSLGAKVIEQDFKATAYTGEVLNGTNIIAQYNPDNPIRIILCAHWDSRHISDHDPIEENRTKPVLGADDGGSGVGVLMEIARHLQQTPIELGVDIIFFDLEDYGESQSEDYSSWCLGSQHWSKNLHKSGYKAKYGILLDMVGASNAQFTMEEISMSVAPTLMRNIWKLGQGMGYTGYFLNDKTKPIIDDHLFINQIARIPTIDIINKPKGSETGFTKCWHTQCDDLSNIDKRTLRAVGQTVLATVYRENNGTL
jgi:Zn-dependent M28 family amino/carboxypeptidase